jgi:hypothetical protein
MRGIQVKIIYPNNRQTPAKVVRVHKPRNGGGVTLAEFSNRDLRGVENAQDYIAEKGHKLA